MPHCPASENLSHSPDGYQPLGCAGPGQGQRPHGHLSQSPPAGGSAAPRVGRRLAPSFPQGTEMAVDPRTKAASPPTANTAASPPTANTDCCRL